MNETKNMDMYEAPQVEVIEVEVEKERFCRLIRWLWVR